jgi:hypothetical protein
VSLSDLIIIVLLILLASSVWRMRKLKAEIARLQSLDMVEPYHPHEAFGEASLLGRRH